MRMLVLMLALVSANAWTADLEIKEVDPFGHVQYHKPGYIVEEQKIVPVDPWGHKLYHSGAKTIKGKAKESSKSN